MKIPALLQPNYHKIYYTKPLDNEPRNFSRKSTELSNHFYYPTNITFGFANSKHIKTLFGYGLPCMYTGIEMVDPRTVQAILKRNINRMSSQEVCKLIEPFANSLHNTESEVFNIIREQAELEPHKTIQETLQTLKLEYEYELVKKQLPVFRTLMAYSHSLPENLIPRFNQLMADTEDKINSKPINARFSVTEFKYKLDKIKEDVAKLHDKKSLGVVNQLIKISDGFAPKTNEKNIDQHRKIVSNMETILKRSVLKENNALNELLEASNAKLHDEKILVPFSRKAFIYDLSQIIKELDDSMLKETFMKITEKLPTSKDSTAAYITKFAKEPSDKTVYCLFWPSIASIEHILPKANGGKNEMANYGGACARENSDRHNLPFTEQLMRRPNTAKYCQKYIDRLIKYAKMGIFEKEGIDVKYIEDFKETIATQSEGAIVLDTSKLYKGGRFKKPESAVAS